MRTGIQQSGLRPVSKAFTLIELLVMVAITALLLGRSPPLKKTRLRAMHLARSPPTMVRRAGV